MKGLKNAIERIEAEKEHDKSNDVWLDEFIQYDYVLKILKEEVEKEKEKSCEGCKWYGFYYMDKGGKCRKDCIYNAKTNDYFEPKESTSE